ncbi:MAG: hypothetical protein WC847_02315 [Candidatus Paceibacterota bacterium]|jgi:hypothetical protein
MSPEGLSFNPAPPQKQIENAGEVPELKEKKKWTFKTLKEDVIAKGIKSSYDYTGKASRNNWPNPIVFTSMPGFPKNPDGTNNWGELLGREEKIKWTYESLQKDVQEKRVKSTFVYKKLLLQNNWPSLAFVTRMQGFPRNLDGTNNWDAFFGRENDEWREKSKWTYESLQGDVQEKKIKSSEEYQRQAAQNNWLSFKTLTSMSEFPKKSDGTNNWDAFLERDKFDLEKFRLKVIAKRIKSSKDYQKNASRYNWPTPQTLTSMPGFPKNPDQTNNWDEFLGREKRVWKEKKEWTFETLQRDVREKGIKSSKDYQKNAARYGWPTEPKLTSMPEFPKKFDEKSIWPTPKTPDSMLGFLKNPNKINDWDEFFGREKTG